MWNNPDKNKEKRIEKNKESLCNTGVTIEQTGLCIIGMPEREEEEQSE